MLNKFTYKYVLDIAPVRITWRQELVEDEDMGYFYLKLIPHVEFAEDMIEHHHGYGLGDSGIRYNRGAVKKAVPLSVLGANARNKYAVQGQKIFKELKADTVKDLQNKLRIENNKRHGQRWNKKV